MKKMYKAMLLVLCAVLLVAGSVMGTLAYLQMTTGVAKNTFTVGNVSITLDEAKTNEYGEATGGRHDATDTANKVGNVYKLVPGRTYTKDPIVTVVAKSEKCYLFVKVENGISNIEATGNTTIEKQIEANGWEKLTDVDDVYYKVVDASKSDVSTPCPVFKNFTIATNANVAAYSNAEVKITAYAIQEHGFTDANDAWTKGGFN